MAVRPMKYFKSLQEVIVVLPLNVVPKFVTEAASSSLNSPSPFVSQLATQLALTLASVKVMTGDGIGTMFPNPLHGSVVRYFPTEPSGTWSVTFLVSEKTSGLILGTIHA